MIFGVKVTPARARQRRIYAYAKGLGRLGFVISRSPDRLLHRREIHPLHCSDQVSNTNSPRSKGCSSFSGTWLEAKNCFHARRNEYTPLSLWILGQLFVDSLVSSPQPNQLRSKIRKVNVRLLLGNILRRLLADSIRCMPSDVNQRAP